MNTNVHPPRLRPARCIVIDRLTRVLAGSSYAGIAIHRPHPPSMPSVETGEAAHSSLDHLDAAVSVNEISFTTAGQGDSLPRIAARKHSRLLNVAILPSRLMMFLVLASGTRNGRKAGSRINQKL